MTARARGRRDLVLAIVLLFAALPIPARGDAAPVRGVQFSGLAACEESGQLVFRVHEADAGRADTVCVDPATGDLFWSGGPVRGLAFGAGDTVHAAARLGLFTFAEDRCGPLQPWAGVLAGPVPENPADWPRRRGVPDTLRAAGAVRAGEVQPFPERYHRLPGGVVLFLVDAEYGPAAPTRLHDLHARLTDGVEWTLARNLAVRQWVLSADSTHWALVADEHRPDYGGSVLPVLLAGQGEVFETFDLGPVRELAWSGDNRLWLVTGSGSLVRILPRPGAWNVERPRLGETAAACPPAEPESLWAWSAPGIYPEPGAALTAARALGGAQHSAVAWGSRERAGVYRASWGGFLGREELEASLPEPPVEGATVRRVAVRGGTFVGSVARVRAPGMNGVATLRQVLVAGRLCSEVWWRFTGGSRAVRLAGPWGL